MTSIITSLTDIVKQLRRLNHILEAAYELQLTENGYIRSGEDKNA